MMLCSLFLKITHVNIYNIVIYNNFVSSLSLGVTGKMSLDGLRIGLCCFRQYPLAYINVFLPARSCIRINFCSLPSHPRTGSGGYLRDV